jgi:hypothetical protein
MSDFPLPPKESSLLLFARQELERAGMFDDDSDYGGAMGAAVLKMIERFCDEEHSGASASIALAIFERLARYMPITPLTGDAEEWTEVDEGVFQNKRCASVFKDKKIQDGRPYNLQAYSFKERETGNTYRNRYSGKFITFPYVVQKTVVLYEDTLTPEEVEKYKNFKFEPIFDGWEKDFKNVAQTHAS